MTTLKAPAAAVGGMAYQEERKQELPVEDEIVASDGRVPPPHPGYYLPAPRAGVPGRPARSGWGCGAISPWYILRVQHWGSVLVTLLCLVALLWLYVGIEFIHHRPFSPTDPTLAYTSWKPKRTYPDRIPAAIAVIWPILMLFVGMFWVEFRLYRHAHLHVSNAIATFIHFTLDIAGLIILTLLLTQIGNLIAGELRPDWLDRCKPVPGTQDCTSTDSKWLRDGKKAFPSGHAVAAVAIGYFNAYYLIWALHYREGGILEKYYASCGRWWHEIMHGLSYVFIMTPLAVAWGITASRLPDNKHNSGDLAAGMVLGLMFAIPQAFRAVRLWRQVVSPRFSYALAAVTNNKAAVRGAEAV